MEYRTVELWFGAKMEQQPDFELRGSQVIEYLPASRLVEFRSRLCLDQNLSVDDHVDALITELDTLISDHDTDFARDFMTSIAKLVLKCEHIEMLEKTETEGVVHLEERADDGVRQFLF